MAGPRWRGLPRPSPLLLLLLTGASAAPIWCTAARYQYYRWTVTRTRGFPYVVTDCGNSVRPDGCSCADGTAAGNDELCLSGFCDENYRCVHPLWHVSELELWYRGSPIRTDAWENRLVVLPDVVTEYTPPAEARKIPSTYAFANVTAWRVRNGLALQQRWGVRELNFFSDAACTVPVPGGTVISSGEQVSFGLDEAYLTTYAIVELLNNSKDVHVRDGDVTTRWFSTCQFCAPREAWIGVDFGAPAHVECVQVLQYDDAAYFSSAVVLEAFNASGSGRWEEWYEWEGRDVDSILVLPPGTLASAGTQPGPDVSQQLLDHDFKTHWTGYNAGAIWGVDSQPNATHSVVLNFGVAVAVDGYRWATAATHRDVAPCDVTGPCPRDPVRWTLEGSIDGWNWRVLSDQWGSTGGMPLRFEDYPATHDRYRWTPVFDVRHLMDNVAAGDVADRGQCLSRR